MKFIYFKLGCAVILMLMSLQLKAADINAPEEKSMTAKRVLHYKTLKLGAIAQRYEIELFEDGEVVYTGRGNVNRMGVVKWRVSPTQIEPLVQKIWQQFIPPIHKVNTEPVDIASRPVNPSEGLVGRPATDGGSGGSDPESKLLSSKLKLWHLEVRNRDKVRLTSQGSGDPVFDKWLREMLEQFIPTKSIRCPFLLTAEFRLGPRRVLPVGSDICELKAEIDRFTPNFSTK